MDDQQEALEQDTGAPVPTTVFEEEDGLQMDKDDLDAMGLFESMGKEPKKESSEESPEKEGESSSSGDDSKTAAQEGEAAEKQPTANELAEKRAKELSGEESSGQVDDEQEQIEAAKRLLQSKGIQFAESPGSEQLQPRQESKQEKPTGKKLTKEGVANFLSTISDEDLPDDEIQVGEMSINLKEFAKDLPESWAATKMLAGAMVNNILEKMMQDGQIATASQVQAQSQQMGYWMTVMSHHPDAMKLQKDDGFNKWLDGKGAGWVKMASSWDPQDAVMVLDAYKEELSQKAQKGFDDKARESKKRKDDLHAHTARGTQGGTSSGSRAGRDVDEEKLFAEAASKLQG